MTLRGSLLFAALGCLAGVLNFALLRQNVRGYLERGPTAGLIALQLLRIGALVAAFWIMARMGGAHVLAALAGFLVARAAWTRRLREGG